MKIEANGIQINCELSGKSDAPVVMLSHSLACSMVMWNPQLDILQSQFNVLRYDMRGHGDSQATEGAYTLEQLAADVIGLLDALEIDVVHFVGLSIGGMIGQCLALNYTDRLLSLALCDTAPIIPEEAHPLFRERMRIASTGGMEALVQETLERWFTQPYLKQNPPEVDLIAHQIATTSVAGYLGCSEAIGACTRRQTGKAALARRQSVQAPAREGRPTSACSPTPRCGRVSGHNWVMRGTLN